MTIVNNFFFYLSIYLSFQAKHKLDTSVINMTSKLKKGFQKWIH